NGLRNGQSHTQDYKVTDMGLRRRNAFRDHFYLAIPHSKFPPSNLRIGAHTCTNHTVPYGTALLGWRSPRHFVPGYDHAVPLGRNTFRAEALTKLALMLNKLGSLSRPFCG